MSFRFRLGVDRFLAPALSIVAGTMLVGAPASPPPLERAAERWVAQTLRDLTLEQKIGQMIVPSFDASYVSTESDAFDGLVRDVRELRVGGFLVFGQRARPVPGVLLNDTYGAVTLANPFDAASLINRLQALAAVPLLNGADFETGVGMRFSGATGFPRAMAFGAVGDEQLTYEAGRITALEGRAIGIQVAFAPVADVNNNPRNPVINTRSFGEDPERVGALASAFARGVAAGGMIATVKHFPGHGDTEVDSHLGLPIIAHPRDRLEAVELKPFRLAVDANAGAVMVGHIAMTALGSDAGEPATFNGRVVTDLLRGELGFGGLIYTDSMSMQAIEKMLPPGTAAVRAVKAGNDFVIESPDDGAALQAIRTAVDAGEIPVQRIDASVRRILEAKARLGLHASRAVDLDLLPRLVGARAHQAIADEVSRRSITLIRDERDSIPLGVARDAPVLYLSVLDHPREWGVAAPSRTFRPELEKRWPHVTAIELSDRSTASELDLVRAMVPRFDAIVANVFVRTASGSGRTDLAPGVVRLLQEIARASGVRKTPFITTFFGNPYAATSMPSLPAVLLTYDFYDRAEASAVRAIAGEAPITGHLPIALEGMFPIGHGLERQVRVSVPAM